MKTTQYVRQEKSIAAADSGSIRERWLWGLRLLRDPDAFSPGSSQLKPGRADELVKAAATAGLRLTVRERFAARDRERQAYLNALIEAAGGDLSMTWQAAHSRLTESPAGRPEPGPGVDVPGPGH